MRVTPAEKKRILEDRADAALIAARKSEPRQAWSAVKARLGLA